MRFWFDLSWQQCEEERLSECDNCAVKTWPIVLNEIGVSCKFIRQYAKQRRELIMSFHIRTRLWKQLTLTTDHWTTRSRMRSRSDCLQTSHDKWSARGCSEDSMVLALMSGRASHVRYALASAHARVSFFCSTKSQEDVGACGCGGGRRRRFSASVRPRCRKKSFLR